MLTLEELIAEATALPDADKVILMEKLAETMSKEFNQNILNEGVKKAQERLAEIESGAVQTIPGETLTKLRSIAKRTGKAPSDKELQAEYTDYLVQKYQ